MCKENGRLDFTISANKTQGVVHFDRNLNLEYIVILGLLIKSKLNLFSFLYFMQPDSTVRLRAVQRTTYYLNFDRDSPGDCPKIENRRSA